MHQDNNIDALLDCLSIEELQTLANGDGSTINIQDSTINIYNTPKRYNTSTPPEPPYCYDCEQLETSCRCEVEYEETSNEWYTYPIWMLPFIGAVEITKGVWTFGKELLFADDNNKTIALPKKIDTAILDDVIDTEIIQDVEQLPMSTSDKDQLSHWMGRNREEELSNDSQRYTELFNRSIA